MDNWISFEAHAFLEQFDSSLKKRGVDLGHWWIDHLCYRTETVSRYEEMKRELSALGTLLIESPVNGRPIATYRLNEPILSRGRRIDVIELPAPKPSKPTRDGFEHAEVVCNLPFNRIRSDWPILRYDDSGLRKSFNRELEVDLGGIALKFHHLSLESVVRFESNERVLRVVQDARVLEMLSHGQPLIAGTFPLGLDVVKSDVDIVFRSRHFHEDAHRLRRAFGHLPTFTCGTKSIRGVESLICRFDIDGIPFELFAQDAESVEQTAYRHFLVEERILRLGGRAFEETIRRLRSSGYKTEPAFASALRLDGDPYEALLKLSGRPDSDLVSTLMAAGFAPT